MAGHFVLKVITIIRRMRYRNRRTIAFVVYASATALAYFSAYMIRFEFGPPRSYATTFLTTLPILLLVRHGTHLMFRLTTSRWRFAGVNDVLRLAGAGVTGTAVFWFITSLLPLSPPIPRSVLIIEGLMSIIYTAAILILYRVAFETLRHRPAMDPKGYRRVLIVGAGESGYMLAREMVRKMAGYRPVGFVDDDPHKWGTWLGGLEVIGATDDLSAITLAYRVDEIILAVPKATPQQMRVLVEKCASIALPYRVLPSLSEVLAGNVRLDQVREVRIEDLLGREPVTLELSEVAEDIRSGCALVTGAAGSIGSELSRQIAQHKPDILILLDQAETALFYLELELRERYPDILLIPVVSDIVDREGIETVFRKYRPSHVFHAAAYKHVPMMELNVRESVRNNVFGSYNIAETAGRYGARKFVLVSTDKAVRPRSVMGASKRLAELITLELQIRHPNTVFAAVRFGNVLGSNGSVIPIFRQQLAAGKPLTVTHPDATRYFMTIPEAVQLILQASLLPEIRGSIAMLEMGEPVRIVTLAENLLRLSGLQREERIVFTGLRPGEKLHEELVSPEEETVETSIRKVRIIKLGAADQTSFLTELRGWETILRHDPDEILNRLHTLFPSLVATSPQGHRNGVGEDRQTNAAALSA